MRTRLLAVLLVALVPLLATALAACSRSSSIPFDEWLARADGVCVRMQAAADAQPVSSPLPGDRLRAAASRSRDEVEALRELPEPEGRRAAVDEYLRSLERRIEGLEAYAEAIDKAPVGSPPPIDKLADTTQEAVTQAVALGLESCAGGVDFALSTTTTTTTVPGATPVPTAIGGQPENEETTVDEAG